MKIDINFINLYIDFVCRCIDIVFYNFYYIRLSCKVDKNIDNFSCYCYWVDCLFCFKCCMRIWSWLIVIFIFFLFDGWFFLVKCFFNEMEINILNFILFVK